MTKSEFEDLQREHAASGTPLMSFLKDKGIAYSTYTYWRRKLEVENASMPIAPITIRQSGPVGSQPRFGQVDIPGVTLAFPNGLRAHFGRGSERVLMELFNQSLAAHVLPQ